MDINLKPRKILLILLVICSVQFVLSIIRLIIENHARSVGFISFLITAVFLGLAVVITIDLFSRERRIISGKIINKEGKIIHVLSDDGKMQRFKIIVPEVLELLEADQRIEITSTNITNIPSKIILIDVEQSLIMK
ncbi:hypothetical protein [Paenibacillus mendelii]|uniref:Uncharacterized protein n=1 Tax=Paenibacillus mendelii TaxID=206163 RepID=A0ABV6JII7_9BACL|nr:hypothetical protein [Paenibacillus mendelii]MCQ6557236.1 hypothetical protein [Paenibacillus mendelii]